MSSPILRGGNLVVTEQGIREGVRQVLLPLWNTWYFFALYANASGYEAKSSTSSTDVLDRYLLAKTRDLVISVEKKFDAFDTYSAAAELRDFADVLTNWYIRRSRDRFWDASAEAFDTLYTVLEIVSRVSAPLLPLITEEIWRGLTGGRSVHLTNWPVASELPSDPSLVKAMDDVRHISSVALSLRKSSGLRVRLPLASLTVVTADAANLEPFASIIAEELNVKAVHLVELSLDSANQFGVVKRLAVNSRAAGPRLGKGVQAVISAAKAGDWSEVDGVVIAGGVALEVGEYSLDLVANLSEAAETEAANQSHIGILAGGGFLILDGAVTEALAGEGLVRDVIRAVQNARKEADLDVSDRIVLTVGADDEVLKWIAEHAEMLKSETLSVELATQKVNSDSVSLLQPIAVGESQQVVIEVKKV
jgi:isoleucyl-tRNA synthetase